MVSRIMRGFLSVVGARVGAILVTMITTPIIVRLLGSTQYGEYAVILSALGLLTIILDAGVFDGIRKFIAEKPSSSMWRQNVFRFYIRISLIMSSIVITAMLIGIYFDIPEKIFGNQFQSYFLFGILILLGRQLFSIVRSALMGLSQEHKSEPLRVLSHIVFALVSIPLIYIGLGVNAVLTGRIIAFAVICTIGLYFLKSEFSLSSILSAPSSDLSRSQLLSFSFQSMILALVTESLYHVDILLLQPFTNSTVAGYYKAALVITEFLWFAPVSIQTVFLHSTSRLWSEGEIGKINEISGRATRYTLLLTLLLAIGLAALAEQFVTLYYGPDFIQSVTPLLILLPGTVGLSVARPIFAIGQGKGNLRLLLSATGIAATLNLLLNIILIPRYGMVGAGAATSVSYGSMLLLHILAARKIGHEPLSDLRLSRVLLTTGVAAPIIYSIPYLIDSRILDLLVVPPIGAVIFFSSALLFNAISLDELRSAYDQI